MVLTYILIEDAAIGVLKQIQKSICQNKCLFAFTIGREKKYAGKNQ